MDDKKISLHVNRLLLTALRVLMLVVIMTITLISCRESDKPATPMAFSQEEMIKRGEYLVNTSAWGFPKEQDQPAYYSMLRNVGHLTAKPDTELFVAIGSHGNLDGAVVFFGDMQYYGSGGTATQEKDAAGFRLLAVNPLARGTGVGKLLTVHCINRAKVLKRQQVIIHTTKAMLVAWKMYEKLGFNRSEDLDFVQGSLPVFGFRLKF